MFVVYLKYRLWQKYLTVFVLFLCHVESRMVMRCGRNTFHLLQFQLPWSRKTQRIARSLLKHFLQTTVLTQRRFRQHFNVGHHRGVLGTRYYCVGGEFQDSSSNKTKTGKPRFVRITEHIEVLRQAIEASPRRSACLHFSALNISDQTVKEQFYIRIYISISTKSRTSMN